jgi:hypothetical protein
MSFARRIVSWHSDLAQADGESQNLHLAEVQERVGNAASEGETTQSLAVFDEAYRSGTAPWLIGEPQPAIVALERRPDALVHILALSDTGPGFGPQISDTVIREAFGEGWVLEDVQSSRYRGVIVGSAHAAALGRPVGELVDLPAWLARARRI